MASAALGLTPRWLMLLGAALLLLLPMASAQEPPAMGKARGSRRRAAGSDPGRSPAQRASPPLRSRPPLELRAWRPLPELRRAPRHDTQAQSEPVPWHLLSSRLIRGSTGEHLLSCLYQMLGAATMRSRAKSCKMPDSSPVLFLSGEIGELAGCVKA